MYSLVIKPRAISMMHEAYLWYEEQKKGLGYEFLAELNQCYSKLNSHPEYFGRITKRFHQAALKRFPYVVIYEIMKIEVVVLGMFHKKRNPKFKLRK